MQASAQAEMASRPGTWPVVGGEAATAAYTSTLLTAPKAAEAASDAASAFAACCRALSHKANTALVAQLPLLQSGEVVDLSRNYIGAAGLQAVAVVLPSNSNVREVRAPRNGLTNDAVVIFCRAMRGHGRLAVLDFSHNTDLSLAGGLALLSLAQQLPSLREVHLDGTHVPPVVLSKLQRALTANASRQPARAAISSGGSSAASPTAAEGDGVAFHQSSATAKRTIFNTTNGTGRQRGSRVPGKEEEAQEAAVLSALESRVRAAVRDGYQLPPAVPFTGWRVLEVPILAPPFLFDTEVALLCTEVFPRLNEEFAARQLLLCPVLVVGSTGVGDASAEATETKASARFPKSQAAQRTIGSYNRELHFLPVCDVTAAVARGRFAAIELIGDRPGDYAQASAAEMLELQARYATSATDQRHADFVKFSAEEGEGNDGQRDDDAGGYAERERGTLQPVLYTAHEAALLRTQWLVIATRRETRALQPPAALAPLLTADPSVAHPDRHRAVVRDIVYDDNLATVGATGSLRNDQRVNVTGSGGNGGVQSVLTSIARTLEWDYAAEEHQWKRHVAWRRHVVSSAPVPELVLSQYRASFDCTDAAGALRLKDLEGFTTGIYRRLRTIVQTCLEERDALAREGDGEANAMDTAANALTVSGASKNPNSRNTNSTNDDVQKIFHQLGLLKVWSSTYVQSVAALSSGAIKKNVMNRIVLYAANPPSRNSLLVHGHDVNGLAMLMCRAASRLLSLQHAYTLALYSTRSSVLLEEPTDVRSFVVHVASQLTTDAAVLRYLHAEVDTERLCAFCLQLLSGTVRSTAKGGASARAQASGGSAGRAGVSGTTSTTAAVLTAAGLPAYVAQYVLGGKVAASGDAGGGEVNSSSNNVGRTGSTVNTSAVQGDNNNSDAVGGTHAFVVVVDGIDRLTRPVQPCGALVHLTAGGGAAGGNRAEPANWSDEGSAAAATAPASPFSKADGTTTTATASSAVGAEPSSLLSALLPRALARNVRVIASCITDSSAYDVLRHLGRDSVETLSLGQVSANEVEQYLSPAILSRLGLTFSEDDFECARAKKDAAVGEYMRYLQDAARGAQEAPGFLTQSQVIQAFPQTTMDAAQGVYDRLVCAFGLPLTRNVLGFLTASRWGLTVPELRALLPQLSACRLQELLRLLRPVLEPDTPQEASVMMGAASGNAQLGTVRIVVRSFLDVAHHEALQVVTDEQQIENDQRVWHTQLAQYYLSIVYRCLTSPRPGKTKENGVRRGGEEAAAVGASTRLPRSRPALLAEHRRAMKEVIYHMTQSGAFWAQLDATVLSLPFLQQVYELGLGYVFLRDLTAAFNERYQRHLLGEDIGEATWQQQQQQPHTPQSPKAVSPVSPSSPNATTGVNAEGPRYALPAVLTRMRDYVRFAHDCGLLLSLRPTLVTQTALQIPASTLNSVQRDTVAYLYRQLVQQPREQQTDDASRQSLHRALYFTSTTNNSAAAAAAAGKAAATHLGPITCAAYLPNRKFIVTASRDRSLAWVNPQSGSVIWHARQPTAPVQSLTMSRTSAYVAAVSEDRTVWIYDGLQGKLVSQCRGNEWFDAPIAAVTFSARGRYVWVVTTDTRARCFECETGQLRCSLGVTELLGKPPRRTSDTRATHTNDPSDAGDDASNSLGDSSSEAYAEVVQCSASEWRRKRNYLSVLPDADSDEVCTTVAACEARQWKLLPWKAAASGAHAESAQTTAAHDVAEKARDTLVSFEMTARCRLLSSATQANAEWTTTTATTTASERPEGYKWMVPWETLAVSEQKSESSRALLVFAQPVEHVSEVHLLSLFSANAEHKPEHKPAAAAVRCVFAASSTTAEDAVAVLRASPDGRWLAVGLQSGKIGLFDISSAHHTWTRQLQQQQQQSGASCADDSAALASATVTCEPTCVYTGLMPALGFVSTPICAIAFHRNGQLLFALGRSLQCWRLPIDPSTERADAEEAVGEYVWAQTPTCLTVLPPPVPPSSDVELPSTIAEVCVGDETGRLTLLELWKPNY